MIKASELPIELSREPALCQNFRSWICKMYWTQISIALVRAVKRLWHLGDVKSRFTSLDGVNNLGPVTGTDCRGNIPSPSINFQNTITIPSRLLLYLSRVK
jgi:hypothetical protein